MPRSNILDCIVALKRYTFAVLAGENVRKTKLIRFAASPNLIETLAPRHPSIKRKGTGLDALLFFWELVSQFPEKVSVSFSVRVRDSSGHGF